MQTFEFVLFLLFAVLTSAILERVIPKVSLPLIQIALGIAIGLLAAEPITIDFNPDFFLLIFIAPLLFRDAKNSDKLGLVRNRQAILSLAVGLVVAIMLSVGFIVHVLEPSIPLAVAFALGAALGPTDAVAVASLADTARPGRKESALLSGESLINDASGVVAFQFAIAAAMTGTFAILDASVNFLFSFFGGILFGVITGWLVNTTMTLLDRRGLDNSTFHVMFDITLPFIVYLASEILGVSGILAVVACGIVLSLMQNRTIGPHAAQLSIVSNSAWGVLAFALNGIVFTLLGIELPMAMDDTWRDTSISNHQIIFMVVVITVILVVTRFLWVLALEYFGRDLQTGKRRHAYPGIIHSALVTTIGGPKGAVTLSVVLSTPYTLYSGAAFPHRDLIIFLASGTILMTLLLANFLLPILAPKAKKREDSASIIENQVAIFRRVMERLSAQRTKENSAATSMVIRSYNERIARIQDRHDLETVPTTQLRIEVLSHQIAYLEYLLDSEEIDDYEGYRYLRRLHMVRSSLLDNRIPLGIGQIIRSVWRTRHYFLRWMQDMSIGSVNTTELDIQAMSLREGIAYLNDMLESGSDTYPTEVVTRVLLSHQMSLRSIEQSYPSITAFAHTVEKTTVIERLAYNIELEEIQEALDEGRISKMTAKDMRQNVYLMMVDLEVIGND